MLGLPGYKTVLQALLWRVLSTEVEPPPPHLSPGGRVCGPSSLSCRTPVWGGPMAINILNLYLSWQQGTGTAPNQTCWEYIYVYSNSCGSCRCLLDSWKLHYYALLRGMSLMFIFCRLKMNNMMQLLVGVFIPKVGVATNCKGEGAWIRLTRLMVLWRCLG